MQLSQHLLVLQVIVPFIAAPLCFLCWRPLLAWCVALVAVVTAFVIAILNLINVLENGVQSYLLGGWPPPWGIEYRLDLLSAFVLLIVSALAVVATLYAKQSVEREIPQQKQVYFYTAWLLCISGLLGITITGDAFNVFVFLEISSLSTYILVSLGSRRQSLVAAYRYLIMGTIGATFILIGIGFLYAMTGTLNMQDLNQRLVPVRESPAVIAAFVLIVTGIALKVALFPLHAWLPSAYSESPSAVTVLLSATATKVAIYLLLRFSFTIFGIDLSDAKLHFSQFLMPLAMLSIAVMSIIAVYQTNLKRMLAYSSVAQIGYMILGISLLSQTGLTAAIVHLFNHALIKAALFMALGCVVYRIGSANLNDLKGLSKTMPWTMAAFVVGALSLIGVPLTAGFITKWYLLTATFELGWWPLAGFIVMTSLIAFVYLWKVIEVAYFQTPVEGSPQALATEAPLGMLLPLWLLVAANIYFGLDTSLSAGVASQIAALLLGATP